MKRRRQAAESQEKGVQAVRLRLADIYGGMISSRLKEDAALPRAGAVHRKTWTVAADCRAGK